MLFSYIVGHVPVNFKDNKDEKVIKKQNLRFFLHTLYKRTSLCNDIAETDAPCRCATLNKKTILLTCLASKQAEVLSNTKLVPNVSVKGFLTFFFLYFYQIILCNNDCKHEQFDI